MFTFVGPAYLTVSSGFTEKLKTNRYILPIFNLIGEASLLMPNKINVTTILSVPFEENSFVAHLPGRKDCLVIDPGLEPEKIVEYLERKGLTPAAILITHGHSDHIAGIEDLKNHWPECRLVIGAAEAKKLTDPRLNLSAMFGFSIISPEANVLVGDGDSFTAAGFEMEISHIPGHSSGHVVYIIQDCDPMMVFVGDVIFAGSIGRTDFPDGDFDQLANGIRTKLYTLPDSTILLPGHGPSTTVGKEKRTNPFVRI
jgi:hydroxyacylglutathione hydrolase